MAQRRSHVSEIVGVSAGWRISLLLLFGIVAISLADSAIPPFEPTPAPPLFPEEAPLEVPSLPPLPEPVTPDAVFSDSPTFVPAPCPDPNCPACRSGTCPEAACYRGTDHLGNCLQNHGWDGDALRRCADATVIGTHRMFEHLGFGHCLCQAGITDSWIGNRQQILAERADPVLAALQCKFVNWRLNSMYLVGCIPEGYELYRFIESVPQVEFYSAPLSPYGLFEPGANAEQAEAIDNNTPRPLSAISLDITPPGGELPPNRAEARFAAAGSRTHFPGTQRLWNSSSFHWNASLLNHQPLYFEDVNVERHGFTYGWAQPLVSGVKFFATIPTLPYQLVAQPPQTMQYSLGEGRPGDHAPYVHERLRLNADATVFEAAVIVGLVFLIP